ncbi:MAG: metallophosphoesterase [Acidobacteriota bacterium]
MREHGVQALAWDWVWKRRFVLGVVLTFTASLGVGFYAFWIEPYWIEVTHHNISAPLSSPLKIVHLTDIHTYGLGRRERKMLHAVEAEQPDLIVITGDSINISSNYPGLRDVLTWLHAPLGVWVVRGNHEDWWPVKNEQEFYESAGATLLLNSSREVRDGIWLVGFDDLYGGRPDADKAFAGVPESAYRIALFHSPPYFEKAAGRCDLALAGHTHGGQVRLPLIGPLWLPQFSGKFVAGWFEQRGTRMYVNRGVGTSILDVRFLSRPEIAVITIGR